MAFSPLGASWAHLGAALGRSWVIFVDLGRFLVDFGSTLFDFGSILDGFWIDFGSVFGCFLGSFWWSICLNTD